MRYQGGKARTAARLAELIGDGERYVEPFLGGGSVAEAVVVRGGFDRHLLNDLQPDLYRLWQAVLSGWEPPSDMTRDEYVELRSSTYSSAMRGWAAFAASHSGKYFGGYGVRSEAAGREYLDEARRLMLRKAAVLRSATVMVEGVDYRELPVVAGDVVYCDPPYGTGTGYQGCAPFDTAEFWRVADVWAERGARVLVSEFAAPAGWRPVFEVERAATLDPASSRRTVEALYVR